MRTTTCEEIEGLIERETLGWSEAERLRVEQHLSECDVCRETLAISRFVRDTLREAAGELPAAARTRAIDAALSHRGGRRFSTSPGHKRWLGASVGLLAVAAAAALIVVVARSGSELATRPAKAPSAKTETKLASAAPPKSAAPSAPAPASAATPAAPRSVAQAPTNESTWIDAVVREQHQFAHAAVSLAAGTRARFDAASHTLELAHGRVEVDVDHSRGEPFAVLTQNFRVEVLGTAFAVTPDSVSVTRGKVQVFARDGSVLASELAAGGSYHFTHDAADLRSHAEARASAHQATERQANERATKPTPTRAELAEAQTLRAEAALLAHDSKTALRLYREVGERFAELAAGDNAAFAAAQLSARADPAHERALLEAYLQRFPQGRFRDEAKQRLARLEAR